MGLADQRAEMRSKVRVREQLGDACDERPDVVYDLTGIGDRYFGGNALERFEHDRALGRPPAVDRLLAHAGSRGDRFDRELGVADLTTNGESGVEDRETRALVPA